ncbi:DUF397 domain-containing protein [Streptomyces sp. 4N509B]|uniref:DUF397 domain-containing protein n=1 Tax=Streptomyces sp. 4N509B TaxID=3457413 RepID=UPI003FD0F47C
MSDLTQEFTWQKSSYSSTGDNCVEITRHPGGIAIRESDMPEIIISSSTARLAALLNGSKAGRFARLTG